MFARDLVGEFPVISIMLSSKLRAEMELLLIKELKDFFYILFNRQTCGRNLTRKQMDFQADLLACGIAAYAIKHCKDVSFDQEEFVQLLWDMLQRTYGTQ